MGKVAEAIGASARLCALVAIGLAAIVAGNAARGQAPAPGSYYTCKDPSGKTVRSGQEIAHCEGVQTLTGPTGKVTVIPPRLTPAERRALEECERKRAAIIEGQRAAERVDNDLLARFPDEAANRKDREAKLDDVRQNLRRLDARMKELADARKPLMAEKEFYTGKSVPPDLQRKIDANDAAVTAQMDLIATENRTASDINGKYDAQLVQLKTLWAGKRQTPSTPPECSATPPSRK